MARRLLIRDVAKIIDPEAFEFLDNLTPTEREMWDVRKPIRQQEAIVKARKIRKAIFASME